MPSQCIAVVPLDSRSPVWLPCARPRRRGEFFCAAHHDALLGAILGLNNIARLPKSPVVGPPRPTYAHAKKTERHRARRIASQGQQGRHRQARAKSDSRGTACRARTPDEHGSAIEHNVTPQPNKSAARAQRRRAKPAEQRLKPSPPLTTKDAFAVLFGDATTIAASSSSARAAKPAPIAKSSPPFARAAVKKSAAGKQSPNETVGARPAVPERPASTAQPSSTTPRRSRSKAARLPKRSVILSAAKDLSRPAGKLSRSRSRSRKRKRAQSSPAAAAAPTSTSAAAIAAQPISSAPPPRIRIGDAMRRSGLDEYKVARTFAGVVDKLSDGTKTQEECKSSSSTSSKNAAATSTPRNPSAPLQQPP